MHHSILLHLTTATGQGRWSNPLLSRRRISAVPQQADLRRRDRLARGEQSQTKETQDSCLKSK
jgi:hypothetical protein